VFLDLFEIETCTLKVASFDDQLFLSGIPLDEFLKTSYVDFQHFTTHPQSKQFRRDLNIFKWRVEPDSLSRGAMVEVKPREGVVFLHL